MNATSSTTTPEQSRKAKYLSVYAVVDPFFSLPGSASAADPIELELSTGGPVAAVYSWVEASDFDDLEEDVSEGSRLAKLARRHDGVVRALARRGAVLPVRLGTLFPDAASLTELLDQTADDLGAELDRVRGCEEWDLRVRAYLEKAVDLPTVPADESGTAYLMRRRNERERAVVAQAAISTAMSAADEALTALAQSALELAVDTSAMAMSRGYLVRTQHAAEFETLAAELANDLEGHGCNVRISGPLPPYSFVKIRLERLSQ
jgi:gas vesicle protein GvpL/GvpF